MRSIILGNTYFVNGREFIPITKEKGKFKKQTNIWADQNARKETIYINSDGVRVRKSKLKAL